MTAIVAIRNGKGVMMASDSCAGRYYQAQSVVAPKVKMVGEFLIGYAGSFRVGQIMHSAFSATKFNEKNDLEWHLVNVFVPEFMESLEKNGAVSKSDEVWSMEAEVLVAHGRRIFGIYGDFGVLEYDDEFAAVGCGEDWARGALFALRDQKIPAKQKLTLALEAATKYSGYVKPPFHFAQNYGADCG